MPTPTDDLRRSERQPPEQSPPRLTPPPHGPLLNYSLSTVCPACAAPTIRHACKVRCERCGFTWDCSEL